MPADADDGLDGAAVALVAAVHGRGDGSLARLAHQLQPNQLGVVLRVLRRLDHVLFVLPANQ